MTGPTPASSASNGVESLTSQSTPTLRNTWGAEDASAGAISSDSKTDLLSFIFANVSQCAQDHPLTFHLIFVDALDPRKRFCAGEVEIMVRKLIAGLKVHGLEKGDCVCIHAFNTFWYPLLWLGVIGAQGIAFGLNPSVPPAELQHHLTTAKARFVIIDAVSHDKVCTVASSCGLDRDAIFVIPTETDASSDGRSAVLSLLDHGIVDWQISSSRDGRSSPSSAAAYCTTSGTTGLPKTAVLSHSYFVTQATMIEQRLASRSYQPTQLVVLPVFHAFAAPLALMLPLRLGITTYFLPRFEPATFTRAIETFQITDAAIVPPILTALLNLPDGNSSLKSLRYVLCAGAPITSDIQTKLYRLLNADAVIAQVWGTTEVGWITMFGPSEKNESGSVGRLLPGVQLKIDSSTGNSGTCEALVCSLTSFTGYLHNEGATADAFDVDGFYHTGDLISVRDGKVYVEGRMKEIMKVNGWQVSPTEIENVLLEHEQIADAAVDGIACVLEDGLEVTKPRAYVVRVQTHGVQDLTEETITKYISQKMISYKRLTGGVIFVDAIPRNATGKILRRLLPREK